MKLLRLAASSTLVATLAAIAAACSSPDANSNTTVDGACNTYASAYRRYVTKCASSSNDGSFSDARWASMEQRMRLSCASSLSLPGTGVVPAQLASCANALADASCTAKSADLPACDFPAGTLADGAVCTDSGQCKSESCVKTGTSETSSPSCGTCQPRVALGADCSTNSRCVENATCDFTTKKCIATVKNGVGGSCDFTKGESCQSGLYCDSAAKICKARPTAGQACSSTITCETGLTCDQTSKTCYAPTIATEGQACGTAAKARCGADLGCDPATSKCVKINWVKPLGDCSAPFSVCEHGSCSTAKKCPALIPDGGACTSDRATGVCDDFASCRDGKCQLPGQAVCK